MTGPRASRAICHLAIASVVAVLSTTAAAAQSTTPRIGFEVGGAATYVTVPKGSSRKMGPGIVAGLFGVVPLVATYKLQPELLYEQREIKVLGGRRRYEYLTGALLVRMGLGKGVYITEGPAYHRPQRIRVGSEDVTANTADDISLVIGVGKQGRHVALEGRWDSGIRNVQKLLPAGDVPTRHRSLGFVFALF